MSDHFEVTINSSIRYFEEFHAEWDQLVRKSSSNTIFLAAGWLQAWLETIGRNENVLITQVRRNGNLLGAAAFQERDGIIEFAGKGPSDYSDFIVLNELENDLIYKVVEKILNATREASKNFRHFFLGRISTDGKTLHYMPERNSKLYSTLCRGVVAPTMEMYAAEKKLRKKSLRRNEQGLKRMGKLVDRTYSRAVDILPLLESFFEQHMHRWSNTQSPSLFLKKENREFYRKVTTYLDTTGWLRFTVLKLDDCMIAAHFGFLHAGRFIWYKPTFDVKIAKLSPGEVLLKRLIEQAQLEKASEFDFTIGGEAFKFRFATKIRHMVYVYITDSWFLAALRRTRVFLSKRLRKDKSPHIWKNNNSKASLS